MAGIEPDVHGSADDGVDSELAFAAHAQSYSFLATIAETPPEYAQSLKDCMNAQGFEYLITTPERLISQSELNILL